MKPVKFIKIIKQSIKNGQVDKKVLRHEALFLFVGPVFIVPLFL